MKAAVWWGDANTVVGGGFTLIFPESPWIVWLELVVNSDRQPVPSGATHSGSLILKILSNQHMTMVITGPVFWM